MSVTSTRKISIGFTGDVEFAQEFSAASSVAASGQNQLVNLSSGNNTITVPSGSVGVTIIPPLANTVALILKGVAGDTGVALSLLDPCSLSLLGVSTFVINAASALTGLRLIYT